MTNEHTIDQIRRVVEIYHTSEGAIRPHFIVTGPSGSSKSFTMAMLAEDFQVPMIEINAAQLTREGTSGNSLSKALSPLRNVSDGRAIVFVDEFDKLFISGNTNNDLAHEITNGVQNEFLKVLEGKNTSVFGDYGKYVDVPVDKVLFVFAGAFNGEENIDLDRLREFGLKTEFLGRVGLAYAMEKLSLGDLERILDESKLLADYLDLFPDTGREEVVSAIMDVVRSNFEKNTIGCRILSTLTHQYFINGGVLSEPEAKRSTFQKTLSLGERPAH